VTEVRKSTAKFSTLVAVSGGLVALPVAALELGEVQVRSSIGQPLRASIAYALGPNETLTNTCVTLQRRLPKDSDMPIVGRATVSIGDGVIEIAGKSVVQEPLVSMRVNVNCPYTAQLSREYILFLDPAGTVTQPTKTVASTSVSQRVATQTTGASQRRQLSGGPIDIGTRYRVQDGDSVSRIVERIVNRPVGHWPAIFTVLDANPAAFVDNDPNRIITGSWLTIPDFGATAPLAAAAPVTETTSVVPPAVATSAPAAPRRQQISGDSIGIATRYRVQKGDSVSGIVERIENRPGAHWPAVMAIFDANPDAFMNNDPDMLIIGSWLNIPDFGVDMPSMVADRNILTGKGPATAYPGVTVGEPVVSEPVVSEPVEQAISEPVVSEPVVSEPVVSEPVFGDNAFAVTSEADGDSSITIPDTRLEGPEITSASPNVPTATIQATPADSSSTNWLAWLGGIGLALIAGMLYLGRQTRGRFASSPIGVVVAPPQRRRSDDDTQAFEAIAETIDSELYDDPVDDSNDDPTAENLVLDADLIIGTGLQTGRDVDVAQDFGFAATTALDMELPENMPSNSEESLATSIIPPINIELESILESEVLPDEDDDDYDMSVIVDATKMPNPDDVTQRDLAAVPIETSDDTLIPGNYTVNHDGDYKILEQDYEDEFTATQALNQEIARAAAALTEHMYAKKAGESDDDDTSKMRLASVTALDATVKASIKGDDVISDLEDTGINEALTVNMLETEGTIDLVADEVTAELPAISKKGKAS
jgi:nucleoid-associated protein YgaU